MTDSAEKAHRFKSFKAMGRLFKLIWWRHALAFTLAFSRYFRAPVILSTIGSLILVAAFHLLSSAQAGADGVMDGNKLMPALFGYMSGSVIAGIFMLIAIFIIVMRISGFIRAFLKFPGSEISAGTEQYKKSIDLSLEDGLKTVRAHKGTLIKMWLTSTVIMIPLLFCWCACSFVVVGLPAVAAQYQLPAASVNHLLQMAAIALAVIGLLLSNYSMAVLAMSTMLDKGVKEVTIDSLWLSIVASPALTLVSLAVSLATYIITTPYAVPLLFQPMAKNPTLAINYTTYLWQVWQGLSSMIVIPMSVAMLCEVLRDSVVPLEP